MASDVRRERALDAIACLLLVVISWIVYRKMLRLWWMFDDPFLFNILTHATIADTLVNRDLYRMLGTPLFNPLLFLSLKLDLLFFGLTAHAFYLHQMVSVLLIAPTQYVLVRMWSGRFSALATSIVTMIGPPMLNVVPELMLRHYVEGAVLAFATALFFVRAIGSNSAGAAIASGALYFLASAAKEIYVPLPALLLVIPEGSWQQRTRLLIPHAIAAAGYAVWRLLVIGPSVGLYGFVVRPDQRLRVLATLPVRAFRQFAGAGSAAAMILTAAIVLAVIVIVIRLRSARLPVIVGLLIALIPIVPVATELQVRWAFSLWLLAATALSFLPRALPPVWGHPALAVVLVAAVASQRSEGPNTFRRFQRMSDEARVFAGLGPADIMHNSATSPVTLGELKKLSRLRGRAFFDELDLCRQATLPQRVFEYDSTQRQVRDVGPGVIASACRHIRDAPLTAEFTFEEPGSFFWHLGPYANGFAFILVEGQQAYEVMPDEGFRSPGLPGLNIRVRYRSPEGWTTYSPEFHIDMFARKPIAWRR